MDSLAFVKYAFPSYIMLKLYFPEKRVSILGGSMVYSVTATVPGYMTLAADAVKPRCFAYTLRSLRCDSDEIMRLVLSLLVLLPFRLLVHIYSIFVKQ